MVPRIDEQIKNCKSCYFGRKNELGGLDCYLNPPVTLTVASQPTIRTEWGRPPVKTYDECKSWSSDQESND